MQTAHNSDDLRRRLASMRRAAAVLAIPIRDLERDLADLTHVKVSDAVLFDLDALRAFLLSRARESDSPRGGDA